MTPPKDTNNPIPPDPKDIKKVTDEIKKQADANKEVAKSASDAADANKEVAKSASDAADANKEVAKSASDAADANKEVAKSASDAADANKEVAKSASDAADATKKVTEAGKEEVKLTKEQIEQKKKLADIAAKAKEDKKEAIEAGKTQAAIAKSFEKISFLGIFKARIAMKGFMKSLKSMDGMKIETKIEGIGGLGEAFSKLSSLSFFGARRAKRGIMILGGALVDMQKMSEGPLEITTTGLGEMSKMIESMGKVGFFAGRRIKKFLKTFIGYLTPFMKDITKLDTGPAIEPIFKIIDAFSKFADKGRKANKAVKILAKSIGTLMGMKIKKGKAEKGGVGTEEVEREKERTEEKRHDLLIDTLKGISGDGKGDDKKKSPLLGALFSVITGLMGMISKIVFLKGMIGKALGGVKSIFGKKSRGISKTSKKTTGIIEEVINTIKKLISSFVDVIKKIVNAIGDLMKKIINTVVNAIKKIGKAIGNIIMNLLKGLGEGLSYLGNPQALLGALSLLIVAGGIFVLAKAFQAFTKVDFKTLLIGIVAIAALAGVMVLVGMSGPLAIIGAAAMLVMASAALVLGVAFSYLSEGISLILEGIGSLVGTLGAFIDSVVNGFIALAAPGVGTGLLSSALGIVAVTAALAAFLLVGAGAGIASAAAGIGSAVLGGISSFLGGPGAPPGPFEMLDKFIGFSLAVPFLEKGANAIAAIGAALNTFLGMNFAAVGKELGNLAMILMSFDAVTVTSTGGLLGILSFGMLKAKSPMTILKELIELVPGIRVLGDAIYYLANGMQMLTGVSSGSLETATSAKKIAVNSGNLQSAATAVGNIGKSSKQDLSRFQTTTNSSELARLQGVRARITEKGPVSGSMMAKQSYERKLDMIDKSIGQLNANLSSGGYAAGGQMDASTKRLRESQARNNQQAMTPRYQEVNTMQLNQTQQFLGGMTARSPGVADDDDL